MVNMIPVASSNIKSVGYNPQTSELFVAFHYGKTYIYSNVPSSKFESLLNSGSKGSYLESFIKGVHPYRPY